MILRFFVQNRNRGFKVGLSQLKKTIKNLEENYDEIGKVDNAYGFWDKYSGGKSLISVESEEDTLAYIIYGKIVKKD